jgi:hypothetical protein
VTYKVTLQPVQPEVSWMYAMWNKMYNWDFVIIMIMS